MIKVKRNKCSCCRYSFVSDVTEDNLYLPACIYILITGKRRPCEAGDDCEVFERRMKKHKYGRDYHFEKDSRRIMAKMYLMSGMSGAGKTTFAQQFAKDNNLQYLCIDDFYALINGSETRHEDEHYVWQVFFLAIHLAEEHGRDIIIDTNAPTKSKRIEFLDWFPHFEHHLIFIQASEALCIKNNAKRKRQIPSDEMVKMFAELEYPMCSEDRRWDSITMYRNEDNTGFSEIARFRYNELEGGWWCV